MAAQDNEGGRDKRSRNRSEVEEGGGAVVVTKVAGKCIEWSILGSLLDTSLGFCVMPKSLCWERDREGELSLLLLFGVYWVLLMAYEIDFWLMSNCQQQQVKHKLKQQLENGQNKTQLDFQ